MSPVFVVWLSSVIFECRATRFTNHATRSVCQTITIGAEYQTSGEPRMSRDAVHARRQRPVRLRLRQLHAVTTSDDGEARDGRSEAERDETNKGGERHENRPLVNTTIVSQIQMKREVNG